MTSKSQASRNYTSKELSSGLVCQSGLQVKTFANVEQLHAHINKVRSVVVRAHAQYFLTAQGAEDAFIRRPSSSHVCRVSHSSALEKKSKACQPSYHEPAQPVMFA